MLPSEPPRSKRSARAALQAELALIEAEIEERTELARREAERVAADRLARLDVAGLIDFVPLASPQYVAPRHLAKLAEVFDRIARGERVRVLLSVPAQHTKTETILHAIAWLLRRRPTWPVAYVTYSQDQADKKSIVAQRIARSSGAVTGDDRATMQNWSTAEGGGAMFTAIGGPLSGNGQRVVIVDDPYKNRIEADSALIRSRVEDWFTSVVITRLPETGSCVVVHTRWHEGDLIGRLAAGEIGDGDWEYINLPFLGRRGENDNVVPDNDGDVVLWPRQTLPDGTLVGWTVEGAKQRLREVGPYDAASIYQGQPRPRGGTVYQQPVRCDAPQIAGARLVIGCDPAGTDGINSNHSVLVALAVRDVIDPTTRERSTVADVAGVLRLKLRPEHAAPQVLAWQRSFGGTPLHIESTRDGKDLGNALAKIARGLTIKYVAATGDKWLRAQPPAAAWNAGRIRVPADARTMRSTTDADLASFVRVVTDFTGMGGEDDDADALAHAWSVAQASAAAASSFNIAI